METWRAASVPSLPGRGAEPYLADTGTGELTRAAAGQRASLYACGITPYDATHLGHAATYVAWDLLVRAWRDAGHDVAYVQNVTDVDDPLLERADRDGEDWRALADREIARYRADMEALRVLPPTRLVGAVEALPLIEHMNRVLAERGALYDVERDMYFSRAADPDFGSVSNLDPATMMTLSAERGGDPGRPGKKDPLDALVWLMARPGEPSWGSGFGPGRPGWHVECAAIATHFLGSVFDVQAGGSDLIFPHHELSASHARVAFADGAGGADQAGPADWADGAGGAGGAGGGPGSGGTGDAWGRAGVRAFARCFAHSGMVRLDGTKMSKSLGNLVFVSGLLADGVDPMAVRLAILAHHYRPDWDWTDAGLAAAMDRLSRWRDALRRALAVGGAAGNANPQAAAGTAASGDAAKAGPGVATGGDVPAAEGVLAAVRERVAADLDAPGALAAVDRWASAVIAAQALPAGIAASAALVRDTVDALLGISL